MVHKRHHRIESRPRFRKLHLFFSLVARVKNLHHFEREQRGHLLVGPDGAEELLLRHLPVLVGVHLREGRVGQAGFVLARLLVVVAQELEQVLDDLLQLTARGRDSIVKVIISYSIVYYGVISIMLHLIMFKSAD